MKNKIIGISLLLLGLIGLYAFSDTSEQRVRENVIMLKGERGLCSGIQINIGGRNYILTAGHCTAISSSDSLTVVLENKKELMRHIIAEDRQSDLLLLEGVPGLKGIKIADYVLKNTHLRTFTHGSGMDTYKTEGEMVGYRTVAVLFGEAELCKEMPKFRIIETIFGNLCLIEFDSMVMTARVVPGSSGGAIINDSGELVGIVSYGDSEHMFSGSATLSDIHRFLAAY